METEAGTKAKVINDTAKSTTIPIPNTDVNINKVPKSNLIKKAKLFLTPMRMFSILLILFGIVNHISPSYPQFEEIFRGSFILLGIFGIFSSSHIRAYVVGIPFLYLSIFYTILKIKFNVFVSPPIPIITTGVIGLWSLFIGEEYERSTTSIIDCIINRLYSKHI